MYVKQTWTNAGASDGLSQTDQANAERLGYIEDGIEDVHNTVDGIIAGDGGTLALTLLPPGSRIHVIKADDVYGPAGSWPAARPTARTDVYVTWEGDTDPGALSLDFDHWDIR